MRPIYLIGMLLVIVSFGACSKPAAFDLAKPTFHTLDNGMKVFILEDLSLPTFRLSLIHPAGQVFEGAQELGLAEITAEVLRTGGTKHHTVSALDQRISDASASIELGASREAAWASLSVLKEDRREMLALLAEILQEPGFEAAAFEVARRKAQVALRKHKEKPSGIAALYYNTFIYGANSPWAAVPTEAHLESLTLEQVRAFYKRYYAANRMILSVAGDFKTASLMKELNETLGRWNKKATQELEWPSITPQGPQRFFVSKEASQVALSLGHIGGLRTDPDKFAAIVANFILGGSGSMTSRLGTQIRSSQGQAYGVWSHFGFGRVPGVFVMVAATAAHQHQEVASSMRRVLQEAREKGVTKKEVEEAKTAILRSRYFQYETRHAIAKAWAQFEFWGYPQNYIEFFSEQIRRVTLDDVNRVLKEHFHPDKLTVMIVGPEKLWKQVQERDAGVTRFEVP